MSRIASAMLIVAAIVAMNTLFLRDAMAEQATITVPKVVVSRTGEPVVTETRGGTRVLALVTALRAVQAQGSKR